MTYVPRPFASGDTLVSSRDPIRTNFTLLEDRFNENHVNLDGGVGGGKHSFLQIPETLTANILATADNEVGFYAKFANVPVPTASLFYRSQSSGSEYQLTRAVDTDILEFGTNTQYEVGPPTLNGGWTFLPGGLIMQYGRVNSPSAGNITVLFPSDDAFNPAPFSIQLTVEAGAGIPVSVRIGTITRTQFEISLGTAATSIFWTAIGI